MRGLPSVYFYMITAICKVKIYTIFFATNQFAWKKLSSITNKGRSLKLYQSSVLQHDALQQGHAIPAAIRKRAYAISVGISSTSGVKVWYSKHIKPATHATQNNK